MMTYKHYGDTERAELKGVLRDQLVQHCGDEWLLGFHHGANHGARCGTAFIADEFGVIRITRLDALRLAREIVQADADARGLINPQETIMPVFCADPMLEYLA